MKKLIVFALVMILAFSLMSGCGGNSSNSGNNMPSSTPGNSNNSTSPASDNGGDNNTSTPAKQDTRIIKASELITLEDAGRILGGNVTVNEKSDDEIDPLAFGRITTIYNSDAGSVPYYISIGLYQNATLDENNTAHKHFLDKGGIADYQKGIRADRESKELAVIIDNLGDWSCITGFAKLNSMSTHTLEIGYGDYCISITMLNWPNGNTFSDEEKIAWKTEKLTEAGKLALDRLKAIIG